MRHEQNHPAQDHEFVTAQVIAQILDENWPDSMSLLEQVCGVSARTLMRIKAGKQNYVMFNVADMICTSIGVRTPYPTHCRGAGRRIYPIKPSPSSE